MRKILKTACLSMAFLCTLLFVSLFGACTQESKKISVKDYIGTYESIFVDAQDKTNGITFTLEIEDDGTFTLSRQIGTNDPDMTYSGSYLSYTENGKTQLLCVENSDYEYNAELPHTWTPYFTVCLLDDGTLMGTPGTTNIGSGIVGAFGKARYSTNLISLVLFTKE